MKRLRCAIYTRVSTEHGLEQEFNSLHAQREAAEVEVIRQPEQIPTKPIRSETTLLRAIAQSRSWVDEILSGDADLDKIAIREGTSARQARRAISLAFLAPDIVQAAISGTLPRHVGVTALFEPALGWAEQRRHLGLAPA